MRPVVSDRTCTPCGTGPRHPLTGAKDAVSIIDDLSLEPLPGDLARCEQRLSEAVVHDDKLLGDVAGHLLAAGGKRLRPTLAMCAAYAAQGASAVSADVLTGAASVELVHVGSLYHDDVIDEAETRRGVPSVNARGSNITAILAGDFLLARASSLAASLGADVAALLADTIGELCRGQVLELQYLFNAERDEETYLSSIEGKTASLLATAARVGGMVSNVHPATLDALTQFGHHLGMCFQIVDDVLDLTQSEEQLGKPSGNDLHEGVYTLPVIYAARSDESLRTMLGRRLDWPDVEIARTKVLAADAIAAATAVAQAHATKARDALDGAEQLDTTVVARLGAMVDGLVTRSF